MINTRKPILLSVFFLISSPLTGTESITAHQQFDVQLPQQAEKSSRKSRMRKSKSKEKKEKKPTTYLHFDHEQLIAAKDAQKARGNTSAVIKYLEQLLKLCTDVTQSAEHLLELADTFFIDKQFKKCARIYTQYCSLYPGSEKLEYALYKSIESAFACILSIDRDQTQTEETLGLTEVFLLHEHFNTYKEQVLVIQKQCYEQLAASECNVCTFYLTSGKLKAAEKRLTKIRSYWLSKLPTLEPDIIALEAQLAEQKEIVELLNAKKTELAQNSKKHMANRF
jgi:outer membrane assembly lipoprotein YfiO